MTEHALKDTERSAVTTKKVIVSEETNVSTAKKERTSSRK